MAIDEQAFHLTTERLSLRPLAQSDVGALFPFVSDPDVSRHMSWETHRDPSETVEFLRRMEEERRTKIGIGWAISERAGPLCGMVGLHGIERQIRAWRKDCAELGYWVGPSHQGRGYMTEAARAAVEFAFEKLVLRKVTVGCIAENAASKRVIEKLGFRAVGVQRDHAFRHGRWWDHLAYELLEPEWRASRAR